MLIYVGKKSFRGRIGFIPPPRIVPFYLVTSITNKQTRIIMILKKCPGTHNSPKILLIRNTGRFLSGRKNKKYVSPFYLSQVRIIRLKYLFLMEFLGTTQ